MHSGLCERAAGEGAVGDVLPVLAAGKLHRARQGVDAAVGGGEGLAQCGHAQHAPAVGAHLSGFVGDGAGVEDVGVRTNATPTTTRPHVHIMTMYE